MPTVTFTANLERHIDCPTSRVEGSSVGEALAAVFAGSPRLKGYVLDDQGRLRKHVLVLVDGQLLQDRENLSDQVTETASIYVAQALSGG